LRLSPLTRRFVRFRRTRLLLFFSCIGSGYGATTRHFFYKSVRGGYGAT